MARYSVDDVVKYLDRYLSIRHITDDDRALNGLQVENSGRLTRIGAAVDASQASIGAAVASDTSFLIVHHGLFWSGLEPLTDRHGRRIRTLHAGDIALYSAHLPLDCHRVVGNNWLLARRLGLRQLKPFGNAHGTFIGVVGNRATTRENLVRTLVSELGGTPRSIPTGPQRVRRVAVVTGAGASLLRQAREAGADTLVTGEARHHAFFEAEEWGMNLILGGHYATETLGVKAVAAHLAERFGVEWGFFDHPTEL
ncbi:MAG TPA: Nif3-like dinuclear metal center hexameric protein [Gemmatimonadales bacterium]|nr:Nif3-like dinuclear metal center hexameric protein [Gemmatimonadales bacterium]